MHGDPELLAQGWKYLGERRESRAADDLGAALRAGGMVPDNSVIQMNFTFKQYMRTDEDGRLHLLAVQVL